MDKLADLNHSVDPSSSYNFRNYSVHVNFFPMNNSEENKISSNKLLVDFMRRTTTLLEDPRLWPVMTIMSLASQDLIKAVWLSQLHLYGDIYRLHGVSTRSSSRCLPRVPASFFSSIVNGGVNRAKSSKPLSCFTQTVPASIRPVQLTMTVVSASPQF